MVHYLLIFGVYPVCSTSVKLASKVYNTNNIIEISKDKYDIIEKKFIHYVIDISKLLNKK